MISKYPRQVVFRTKCQQRSEASSQLRLLLPGSKKSYVAVPYDENSTVEKVIEDIFLHQKYMLSEISLDHPAMHDSKSYGLQTIPLLPNNVKCLLFQG